MIKSMKIILLLFTTIFTLDNCAQFFAIDKSTIMKEGIENILITKVHKGKELVNKYYRFDKKTGLIHSSYTFNNYTVSKKAGHKDAKVFAEVYKYDKGESIKEVLEYRYTFSKKKEPQVPLPGSLGDYNTFCDYKGNKDTINFFSIGFCWKGIKSTQSINVKDERMWEEKSNYKNDKESELVRSIDVTSSCESLSFSSSFSYKFYYNSSIVDDSLIDANMINENKITDNISHFKFNNSYEKLIPFNELMKVNMSDVYQAEPIYSNDSINFKVLENGSDKLKMFDSFSIRRSKHYRDYVYLFNPDIKFLYYYLFLFNKNRFDHDDNLIFSYVEKHSCKVDFLIIKGVPEYGESLDTLSATLYSNDAYISPKGGLNKFEVVKNSSKDNKEEKLNYNLYYSFTKKRF